MTNIQAFAAKLQRAAEDAIQDDFPSTRHEGAKRFAELCKPVQILELLKEFAELNKG